MYNEDLDKIHHFKIERKHRIYEGGEFGIQKYDLQIDEQISRLPTGFLWRSNKSIYIW